jgi:hypothetical protein
VLYAYEFNCTKYPNNDEIFLNAGAYEPRILDSAYIQPPRDLIRVKTAGSQGLQPVVFFQETYGVAAGFIDPKSDLEVVATTVCLLSQILKPSRSTVCMLSGARSCQLDCNCRLFVS